MYKSTVKKSNIINNLLYTQTNSKTIINKINFDNNQKNQKTFLIDDTKKRLIPKFKEDKRLYNTKSEINFRSKHNQKNKISSNNDFHSIKKEKFLQKLKDMIFSPGDVNYSGKEQKENGGTYNNYDSKLSKNFIRQNNKAQKVNLLPNKTDTKKTLVLDLDETLIHSAFEPFNPRDDITLTMKVKEEEITIHVLKRPYLDEFLNIVTQKYEVIIFTASISEYANPLLDQLDPLKKIAFRLFREHCTKSDNGLFIKDLNRLGRNLKDIIIIDNNPVSFTFNKANGLPILTWHSIKTDNELIKLIPLLTFLSNVDDIRPIINKVVNGYYVNYKEVNKIISNNNSSNNYLLNSNNKDDDYFNNWFPCNIKKIEKKNSFKYNNNKDNKENNKNDLEKEKDKNNDNNNQKNINKRKESFDQLIKYKGLLGSKEKLNFDNYKKSRHTKIFEGFLKDYNNNYSNNGYLTKKSMFMDFFEEKNKYINDENKNDNYDSIYNSRLVKKRNYSSKNLIKITKCSNNENESNNYFNSKKIKKEKIHKKNKEISFNKYNVDYFDNSKLNKTDTNINFNNNNDYQNIIMNNNTNIINNNIYVINNKQTIFNDENNNTIEYYNRNIFNDDINKQLKDGYKSANYFYNKKERSQSAEYKQRQVNQSDELSKLIDNLINYNKNNKNLNINSNQLIAISNNTNYLSNQKLVTNNKINNLKINNNQYRIDLLDIYNMRINKEKKNYGNKRTLLNEFNNKININNIKNKNFYNSFYNSYKNSKNNIYVDTGNNLENHSSKNIKKSFLYDENERIKKNHSEYNNYKLVKHYSNIGQKKSIKYLSPTSNFKMNLYK